MYKNKIKKLLKLKHETSNLLNEFLYKVLLEIKI